MSPTFADIRGRLFAAIATSVGLEPDVFERPGTTVVSSVEREGSGTVAVHAIGAHALVWSDPAVVSRVESLRDGSETFRIETLEVWAREHGAVFVGGARSMLADRGMLLSVAPPDGATIVRLEPDVTGSAALVHGLVEASDPDDVDAAEIDAGSPDPHGLGLLDGSGGLGAMASARPWEYGPEFCNIGVLVRKDHRREGWGRTAVAALGHEIFDAGRLPLYRCNWDREPSHRLALSLGFRETTSVAALRFEG